MLRIIEFNWYTFLIYDFWVVTTLYPPPLCLQYAIILYMQSYISSLGDKIKDVNIYKSNTNLNKNHRKRDTQITTPPTNNLLIVRFVLRLLKIDILLELLRFWYCFLVILEETYLKWIRSIINNYTVFSMMYIEMLRFQENFMALRYRRKRRRMNSEHTPDIENF